MKDVDYQLRLDLELDEEEAGGANFAPLQDAAMRDEIARQQFGELGSKPGWYEEYVKLLEGGWPWRVAVYMAWAGSPKRDRWPVTAEKLATEVLGLTGPRVIYQWRKRNPAIDEMVGLLQAGPLFQHRADIIQALIESATTEGYRGFHDRRLALEMMGDYTPKSRLELGKSATGMGEMSDAELAVWAGKESSFTTEDAGQSTDPETAEKTNLEEEEEDAE